MTQHFGLFLKNKLLLLGLGEADKFGGCTAEEIEQLKTAQGVKCLPQKYIEFLETMGKGAGGLLLRGDTYRYNQLISMKPVAQEIVNMINEIIAETKEAHESLFEIPDDAFVFLMQQGVYFFYFLTADCDDDPPIYIWDEGEGKSRKWVDHFSVMFINAVQELVDFGKLPRKK